MLDSTYSRGKMAEDQKIIFHTSMIENFFKNSEPLQRFKRCWLQLYQSHNGITFCNSKIIPKILHQPVWELKPSQKSWKIFGYFLEKSWCSNIITVTRWPERERKMDAAWPAGPAIYLKIQLVCTPRKKKIPCPTIAMERRCITIWSAQRKEKEKKKKMKNNQIRC